MRLSAKRLLLREMVEADWGPLYAYEREPEFRRYDPDDLQSPLQFRLTIQALIAQQRDHPRTSYYFTVVQHEEARVIGSCYIAVRDGRSRQAEIGYMLGPAFWGQGFATEAANRLLAFGFDDLKLHRIFASGVVSENAGSVRVLEKIGMRREAHFRESHWFDGRWWDTTLYAILEDEWRERVAWLIKDC